MYRSLLVAALLAALFVPAAASGAVISRDWKTPGDGLLTYDDVNKREWLDLPLSRLSLFPGANREERYQSAVAESAAGGMFAGFSAAKSADVTALATSAGVDLDARDYSTNGAAIGTLIDMLGPMLGATTGFARSQGFLDELDFPQGPRRAVIFYHHPPAHADVLFSATEDLLSEPAYNGIMLHRSVVPEPASVTVFLFGIVVVTGMRRRITQFRRFSQ